MKIAQIAPIWFRVPPKKYGGTELVVHNLTEALVQKGHEVTLYASADSLTKATLKSCAPEGLIEQGYNYSAFSYPIYHILSALEDQEQYEIMHFHFTLKLDYITLALIRNLKKAVVTLHVPMPSTPEFQDRKKLFEEKLADIPLVSISNNQRANLKLNFMDTVYNAIETEKYIFKEDLYSEEMLWLSRFCFQKGAQEAGMAAKKTQKKINLVGNITGTVEDNKYFNEQVNPLIDERLVILKGEADFAQKLLYYQKAKLFLFPIQWEEPFGLVMIEAMACGTPVVAFARGSVPEVVKDGVTGFIVNSSAEDKRGEWIIKKTGIEGLCEAVERIYAMPEEQYRQMRRNCRKHVEENFTVEKMVEGYEKVYEKILRIKN